MRRFRLLFLISIFLLCGALISQVALADTVDRQGTLSITPSVGYFRYSGKRHIESQALPALYLGYGFTPQVSGEVFYTSLSSNFRHQDHQSIEGDIYALDGLYHFRVTSPLQPYIAAGVGAIQLRPPATGDAKTQSNLNVGAGIEYGFSNRFSLRAGAHDFYTMVGGKQDILFDAGLTIYFWKLMA